MLCMAARTMLCWRKMSVRLNVIRRYSVETAKRILKRFSPSGSHTILIFPYQTVLQYSDGDPHNGGVECKGYENIAIFDQYLALSQK